MRAFPRVRAALALAAFMAAALSCGDEPTDVSVPAEIVVTPSQTLLEAIDDTVQFTATVRDSEGHQLSDVPVQWTSDNGDVLSMSQGVGQARGEGTAVVSAKTGEVVGRAEVVVDQKPVALRLTPDQESLPLQVNQAVRLAVDGWDRNNHLIEGELEVEWHSGQPSIATVTETGVLRAVGPGEATIFAHVDSLETTLLVSAEAPPGPSGTSATVTGSVSLTDPIDTETLYVEAGPAGSAAVAEDGTFSLDVPTGQGIVLRAKAGAGLVGMAVAGASSEAAPAALPNASADGSIAIDPLTTATTLVLLAPRLSTVPGHLVGELANITSGLSETAELAEFLDSHLRNAGVLPDVDDTQFQRHLGAATSAVNEELIGLAESRDSTAVEGSERSNSLSQVARLSGDRAPRRSYVEVVYPQINGPDAENAHQTVTVQNRGGRFVVMDLVMKPDEGPAENVADLPLSRAVLLPPAEYGIDLYSLTYWAEHLLTWDYGAADPKPVEIPFGWTKPSATLYFHGPGAKDWGDVQPILGNGGMERLVYTSVLTSLFSGVFPSIELGLGIAVGEGMEVRDWVKVADKLFPLLVDELGCFRALPTDYDPAEEFWRCVTDKTFGAIKQFGEEAFVEWLVNYLQTRGILSAATSAKTVVKQLSAHMRFSGAVATATDMAIAARTFGLSRARSNLNFTRNELVGARDIHIVSGDDQTGGQHTELPEPVTVRARGLEVDRVAGAWIRWQVTSGGGSVTSEQTTTGQNGTARTDWTLGADGAQVVEAELFPSLERTATFTASATDNQQIAGTVTTDGGSGLGGVSVAFSNGGPTVTTDSDGTYMAYVPYGYSGTATPSLSGYAFTPPSKDYSNVTANANGEDYEAIAQASPPEAPHSPTPADGTTTRPPAVLDWADADGTDAYDVYLDGSHMGTVSASQLMLDVLLARGSHSWYVKASNDAGATTGPTWTFTVESSPEAPESPTPADGASLTEPPGVLDWADANGADRYFVYLDGSYMGTVSASQWSPSRSLASGSHSWRVEASNDAGTTSGPTWTFTVATDRTLSVEADPSSVQSVYPGPLSAITYRVQVDDQDGAAVSGATVTATDPFASPQEQAVETDGSGEAVYQLTVPEGTSPGTYTVTFQASRSGYTTSGTVSRTVEVLEPSRLVVSPTSLSFSAQQGGSLPAAQSFTISSTGANLSDITILPIGGSGWLSVSGGGTTPVTVTVQPTTTANDGDFSAQICAESPTAENSPVCVDVSYTVEAVTPREPYVDTDPPTDETDHSFRARGDVNPRGLSTEARFELSTSSFASGVFATSAWQAMGSGTSTEGFDHVFEGLEPATRYYYRVEARNSVGTEWSSFQSVTTEEADGLPDLVITEISTFTWYPAPGDDIPVDVEVKNIGEYRQEGAFTVDVYLSANTSIGSTDYFLCTIDFAGGMNTNFVLSEEKRCPIPSTVSANDYYLIGEVDPEGVVVEMREGNNTSWNRSYKVEVQ